MKGSFFFLPYILYIAFIRNVFDTVYPIDMYACACASHGIPNIVFGPDVRCVVCIIRRYVEAEIAFTVIIVGGTFLLDTRHVWENVDSPSIRAKGDCQKNFYQKQYRDNIDYKGLITFTIRY